MSIILNFPADKRVIDIRQEIESRIKSGKIDSFIYIVPTKRKIRELKRRFIELSKANAISELNLFTLELFAKKLYLATKLQKPKRLISDTIQSLVFQIAIQNVLDNLIYFKPPNISNEIPKGTFNKIIDTIIGLKEDGIYPMDLREEIEKTNKKEDKAKLQDLAQIYEQYETLLISNGFIDVPGIFKDLNDILNQTQTDANINIVFKSIFPNVDSIFIDGFSMFKIPETNLIKTLTKIKDISIFIFFDYFEKNDELFGHLNECYNRFIEAGFKKYEIKPKTENDKFAKHLNKFLFNYIDSKFTGKYEAKNFVTLIEAKDRIDEVKTIARLIKKIANERPDIDLSKICVATYRPEKYTPLFREILPAYGIPANITDRFYLERSPLVTSIISLLEIPVNNYPVNEIVKVLMSSYFDFSAIVGKSLKPENIYFASKELKLKNVNDFWHKRIKQSIDIINSKLGLTYDVEEQKQLERELKLFKSALEDFENLNKIISQFTEPMTPSQFKHKLHEILSNLKVHEQILKVPRKVATNDEIERDARAYQKFIEVIDELFEVFEFNMRKREKYRLDYYLDLIKKALPRVRYNIRQKYGYGVYVTTLEETRGLNFDVMIIAGLVDTEFPSIYEPEIFLSEGLRDRLRRTKKKHRQDERYLFYQGVVNFKTHLYLTYPKMDGENELVRSRFIDSLEQVIELEKITSSEIKDGIFSAVELYENYGRFLKANLENLETFDYVTEKFPKLTANYSKEFEYILNMSKINISRSETHDEIYREYEGIIKVDHETEKRKLGEHENRIFSISQIETYGKCPYRYFAERVLNLQGFEEIEELLTPIERGILYHEVLYEFYTEWKKQGKPISQNTEEAKKLIEHKAKEKANEFKIGHPLWEVEVNELVENMKKFVELESKDNLGFTPTYFEVAFGPEIGSREKTDKELSTVDPIQIGKIKIQGKIDRIDTAGDKFIIYDYKTGKVDVKFEEITSGIHLQIPLYIKIAEEIFKKKGKKMKGLGGYHYKVRGNVKKNAVIIEQGLKRNKGTKDKILKYEELPNKINESVQKANEFVEQIIQGKFNLTQHDKFLQEICRFCPYIEICRINEAKFGIQIKSYY